MNFKVELLNTSELNDFPSGSSINFHNGQLFLVGDDSQHLLILDRQYKKIDSLRLFSHSGKRIPKKEKADLEASTFLNIDGTNHLLLMGSGSKPLRKTVHLIPFQNERPDVTRSRVINTSAFVDRAASSGIDEINFEGVANTGVGLVICNRGNRNKVNNHLVITEPYFWKDQHTVKLHAISLRTLIEDGKMPGVSEVYYEKSLDLLLVALTNEETTNAIDDGAIGNSYISWISDFSKKVNEGDLTTDGSVCLPDVSTEFEGEKIEGFCVEYIADKTMLLHMISDNDNGESKLFKIKMEF